MEALAETTDESLDSAFSDALNASLSSETEQAAPAEEPVETLEPAEEAPVESVPEEQPTPAEEAPDEPSALDGLLLKAGELGMSTDGIDSPEQLTEAVLDQIKLMQPAVSYAQQQYEQQMSQQSAQPPAQQTEPEEEEAGWDEEKHWADQYGGPGWKPEFSRARENGLVIRDPESGMWKAAEGAEQIVGGLLPDMNAAQQHIGSFWQNMTEGNPLKVFGDAMKPVFEQMVDARVREIVESREQRATQLGAVSEFEQKHSSTLYKTDVNTGQSVLTDKGQEFVDTVGRLRQGGMNDQEMLLETASRLCGITDEQPPPEAEPKTPPPASSAVEGVSQEAQQKPFLENARRSAQHSPSASGGSSEDGPQVLSEGDLDSMWERAAKEALRK
jgi:hypothetical protein